MHPVTEAAAILVPARRRQKTNTLARVVDPESERNFDPVRNRELI
jgi:hypothetical protein